MGCFLACLGSSNKKKKCTRIHINRVPSGARNQRRGCNAIEQVVDHGGSFIPLQKPALVNDDSSKPVRLVGSSNERESDSPISQNKDVEESNEDVQPHTSPIKSNFASPSSLGSRGKEKSPDKSSFVVKRKVRFNSVVEAYEPVPNNEHLEGEEFSGDEIMEAVAKGNKSNSLSEHGSKASSVGSYPPNHRYQNCRESDDEEELDYEESYLDIDNDDDDLEDDEYSDGDSLSSVESTTGRRRDREIQRHEKVSERADSNLITQDRGGYDHSVLNPVENLSQWKALKAKGKKPALQQLHKENCKSDFKEPSFSHQPVFSQARSLQSKTGHHEQLSQQMAVDASLSNWLILPESLNQSKASPVAIRNVIPQQTSPQGSYSPTSFDDRPILGAMTVEELKLLSSRTRTPSPRKSPSKSPDDMAIIGTVGSYWSHEKSDKGSAQNSSSNGKPNTTSKYREDMRVNRDPTPFETRLEKALNQAFAEA